MTARRTAAERASAAVGTVINGTPLYVKTNPQTGRNEISAGDQRVLADVLSSMTALDALSASAERPVDMVDVYDSNGAFGGGGYQRYLARALYNRFGAYATAIYASGSPTQPGGWDSAIDAAAVRNDASSLGALADFTIAGGPVQLGYLASGAINASTGGIALSNAVGFPTAEQLTLWHAFAADDAFAGSCRPGFRSAVSPYTLISQSATVSTTADAGRDGMRMVSHTIPADPARTYSIEAKPNIPSQNVVGPWLGYYSRVELSSRTAGISCHTLISAASQSAYDMAYYLHAASDAALTTFFAEARRLQISRGYSPIVVININTGLNDRNESIVPSLGPEKISTSGDSAAAYIDNIRAIQRRIRAVWRLNEWAISELYWLIVPSHRIADPDDAKLIEYRESAKALLEPEGQTSVVDLGAMMTEAEASAAGWYDAGGHEHLTATGYAAVSQLIVDLIP